MTLPNFLIVGAAKSGTTSLFQYLGQHPDIYVPPVKEPCYFSDGRPQMACSDKEYETLFSGRTTEKAAGEASTSYLYDPKAPKRIRKLLEGVKIIIILRNPVARAYSAWGHNFYQVGYEKLSFEEALQEEQTRMASEEFREECPFYYGDYHYFHQGLYYQMVKRYFEEFGRRRVKILIFEEFVNDPARACREVFSFLKVDPTFSPEFRKHNVAPGFMIWFIHRLLVAPPSLLKRAYQALPMKVKVFIFRLGKSVYWLNQRHRPRPPLEERVKAKLLSGYRHDIRKLEELLGRDLSVWYTDKKRLSSPPSFSQQSPHPDL